MLRKLFASRLSWQVAAAVVNLAIWASVVFSFPVLRQHVSWVGAFIALFTAALVGGRAWDQRRARH
jgi:hypothetical protein